MNHHQPLISSNNTSQNNSGSMLHPFSQQFFSNPESAPSFDASSNHGHAASSASAASTSSSNVCKVKPHIHLSASDFNGGDEINLPNNEALSSLSSPSPHDSVSSVPTSFFPSFDGGVNFLYQQQQNTSKTSSINDFYRFHPDDFSTSNPFPVLAPFFLPPNNKAPTPAFNSTPQHQSHPNPIYDDVTASRYLPPSSSFDLMLMQGNNQAYTPNTHNSVLASQLSNNNASTNFPFKPTLISNQNNCQYPIPYLRNSAIMAPQSQNYYSPHNNNTASNNANDHLFYYAAANNNNTNNPRQNMDSAAPLPTPTNFHNHPHHHVTPPSSFCFQQKKKYSVDDNITTNNVASSPVPSFDNAAFNANIGPAPTTNMMMMFQRPLYRPHFPDTNSSFKAGATSNQNPFYVSSDHQHHLHPNSFMPNTKGLKHRTTAALFLPRECADPPAHHEDDILYHYDSTDIPLSCGSIEIASCFLDITTNPASPSGAAKFSKPKLLRSFSISDINSTSKNKAVFEIVKSTSGLI